MAQQIIGIGTNPDDGTGDPLRTAFDKSNQNFTELYNLHADTYTSNVTFTVGSDKDFTSFDACMRYLLDTAVIYPNVKVTLTLDDGVYEMNFVDGQVHAYAVQGIHLVVQSASRVKANCILTYPNGTSPLGFTFLGTNANIELKEVTLDGTYNGATTTNTWGLFCSSRSHVVLSESDIKNIANGMILNDKSYGVIGADIGSNCTFTNISSNAVAARYGSHIQTGRDLVITNAAYAVQARWDSVVILDHGYSTSITGSSQYAMYAREGGRVIYTEADMTLSGNTNDYYIPLNEIQYDGSLITNSSAALSFKT